MTPSGSWSSRFKERIAEKMNTVWWERGTIPLRLRVIWTLLRLGGA